MQILLFKIGKIEKKHRCEGFSLKKIIKKNIFGTSRSNITFVSM